MLAPSRPSRGLFCNRTLNLRAIPAVGFDMDYTLVHYQTEAWEKRAYAHLQRRLAEKGFPVERLEFDSRLVALGLVLDLELGNIVKANRFGYVKKAAHGTRVLDYREQRELYSRELIDLSDDRWVFLNTLFALSEGCMYAQCVELLDDGKLRASLGYEELYRQIRRNLDATHMEGALKSEILADPDRYVVQDEELPLALLDLKHAGKKLLLITNSEWQYTRSIMNMSFDPFLPEGITWRDVFEVIIVSASKPAFFEERRPLFEVTNEEGLLRPAYKIEEGGIYLGGHAGLVEEFLGAPGEQILYVGDHIFADVHKSKDLLRWRTALVFRELEGELEALEAFKPQQRELTRLMLRKEELEGSYSQLRLKLQRLVKGYGPQPTETKAELEEQMQAIRQSLGELDGEIAPLARASSELLNPRWGLYLRAGNDKSHLARQIERYADVYTSRVSNLLEHTPYVYLRSPRGSLPHDHGPAGGVGADGGAPV